MARGSRVTWWREGDARQNAGDYLSTFLASELFLPLGLEGSSTHLIGSVIDDLFLKDALVDPPVLFWGAGCRDATGPSAELRARARILAVRGPLTRRALGLPADFPTGEPALVLPALLTPRRSPRTDGRTVAVPHFHDARDDTTILAATGADVVVRAGIPPTREALLGVIDDLTSASFVLSAALHGALIPMAWGVPFAFWDTGAIDLPFKWQDVAALVGVETAFATDVVGGRTWFAANCERIRIPSLLGLLAAAPFLLRPDALLRTVRHEIRRAPEEDAAQTLDAAIAAFAAQRALVDAIASNASALGDATRTEQRLDTVLARLDAIGAAVRARDAGIVRDGVVTALRAEAAHEKAMAEQERAESARLRQRADALASELGARQARSPSATVRLAAGAAGMRARRGLGLGWTTPLLDVAWYRVRYPVASRSRRGPEAHYRRSGKAAGLWPNELFDPAWYLERYPDVAAAGADPVDHYLVHGAAEGRDPHPAFDTRWYLTTNPEVRSAGINPLVHWLRTGRSEGRRTHPDNAPSPATAAPTVEASAVDPPGQRSAAIAQPPVVAAEPPVMTAQPPVTTALPAGAIRATRDPALREVPLVLDDVVLRRDRGAVTFTCAIDPPRALWLRVTGPDAMLDALEPRIEPFLPLALLLAGQEARPVAVRAALEPEHARRLRHHLVPLLSGLTTDHDVAVDHRAAVAQAKSAAGAGVRGEQIALLFSSGADSLYSLLRMQREGWPPDLLVNLNAGAHDVDRECWRRRLDRVRAVAEAVAIPLVTIDTNAHELGWVGHATAHTFRNLAAASVLRPTVGTIVYSAGHRFEATSFLASVERGADLIEPISATAMRWGGLEMIIMGGERGKSDRIATLVDEPLAMRFLDVCTNQAYQATAAPDAPTNCGACHKCQRTLLILEHLGALERFAGCFDMAAFVALRDAAIAHVEASRYLTDMEIVVLRAGPAGRLPPLVRGSYPVRPSAPIRAPIPRPALPSGAVVATPDAARSRSPLVLDRVAATRSAGVTAFACALGDGRSLTLRVAGPEALMASLIPRVEPFLPAALLLAGQEGRGVHVRLPLDPTYRHRLEHQLVPLISGLTTDHDVPVSLTATSGGPSSVPAPGRRVGLVFGGGVDSFSTLTRMTREGWPPDVLIGINAGAHDLDRACWRRRLDRVGAVADALGISMVTIDTNANELAWVPDSIAHMLRNLSAASVLQPVVGTLAASAGHRLEMTSFAESIRRTEDLVEPMTMDAMRWGGMEMVLVGADVRRIDRIAALVDIPLAARWLDVCVDHGYQSTTAPGAPTNCGACDACCRTILVMEHLGILDRFAGCFDRPAFEAVRRDALERLMTRDHPVDAEVRELLAGPPRTLPPMVRGQGSPDGFGPPT